MAEEAPGLLRIAIEPDRIGDLRESSAAEGRLGPPESLRPAEIGQAGINAHASPSAIKRSESA